LTARGAARYCLAVPRLLELLIVASAALAAAGALAACGGDDDGGSEKPATQQTADETTTGADETDLGIPGRVDLETPKGTALVFKPKRVTAETLDGELTVNWDNKSNVKHNICLEDESGKAVFECSKPQKGFNVSTPIRRIKPGRYTYYCSVDGHRQAGMEGTLTVKSG
jgi:plastocyanin